MDANDSPNGSSEKMVGFHIPDNNDLLAAIGEVALRHEHLNYILRMTIRTLASVGIDEALDATAYAGSAELRSRINKLARQRLGEGQALIKVQALLERCKRLTERRNDLVHSVWGKELDGETARKDSANEWQPLPTGDELRDLASHISQLTDQLNKARLDGFLLEALNLKSK
jgi:hypothetical protein